MAVPAVTSDHPTPESAEPSRRRGPRAVTWWRSLSVVAGGLLVYASFPPRPLWWLAPLGFALLAAALHGRRAHAGFGYGFLFGLAYLLPVLKWLDDFLSSGFGPWPWLLLSAIEALFVALPAAGMAVVSRLRAAPVWMAALFIASEAVRSRFPLNGFPWAKIGFGQPEGAFLPLASLGGSPLVGFAVVVTGCGLAQLALRLRHPAERSVRTLAGPAVAALLPAMAGLATWPTVHTDPNAGSTTVAIIQGNAPDAGLDLLNHIDSIERNHLRRAQQLADDIRAGKLPKPDLVIWPETATDLGPDLHAEPQINELAKEFGVPMAVGSRTLQPDGQGQNTMTDWDPVTGAGQQYAKQELVPFAEYVPLRGLARFFTPFVDGFRDMTPGTTPGVLSMGHTRVGFAICYEAAYDWVVTDSVRAGATLLSTPTNNAWFGRTDMSYQQLAMSRLRAVEHGRAVVVSATSGVSAIVQPDGTLTRQTSLFTSDALVATVPLRSTTTLATRLGTIPEWILVAAGTAAVVVAALRRRIRPERLGRGPRSR